VILSKRITLYRVGVLRSEVRSRPRTESSRLRLLLSSDPVKDPVEDVGFAVGAAAAVTDFRGGVGGVAATGFRGGVG
jgi:hypothetical protein